LLSPPDLDLVSRDPDLPGLATVLDPLAMLAALRALHGGIDDAAIFYTRYKPHTSCLVGYRLTIGGEEEEVGVHVRRADAANKFAKAKARPGVDGLFGAGRHIIPALAAELAVFPNDRRLPGLVQLSNTEKMDELVGALSVDQPELQSSKIEKLRYRPERRYVVKLVKDERPVALAKIYRPADFERSRNNACAFTSQGHLRVPTVLGVAEAYGAVASAWLPGTAPKPNEEAATRIGLALATLHTQRPSGLAELTAARQLRTLAELVDYLAALWPPLAKLADHVGQRLSAAMQCGSNEVTSIHGDFHLEQMIEHDGLIGLVDFDDAAMGNPGWDLGNIVGHLHGHDLRDGNCNADGFGELLLEPYQRAGGRVTASELQVQTALGLMRFAARPFRERRPNWPERIEGILTKVDALLGEGLASARQAVASIDPDMPLIEAALDSASAAQHIDLSRLGAGPWTISDAKLIRHKPGRRCLIEYQLESSVGDATTLLGKMRARGVDARAFALQQQLWSSGFDNNAIDGVSVPEPVAIARGLGMWLQRKVPGQSLGNMLGASMPDPSRAAAAIAKLHGSDCTPMKRHRLSDELAILHQRLSALAERKPHLAPQLARLASAANVLAARAIPVRARPIHRDFYQDHLLFDGSWVHLIDLDLVCMGDPAVDIGNFLAHLSEDSVRRHGDPERLRDWQHAFESAYRRRMPEVPGGNIRLYELLSLARLVEISDQMPERRPFTEDLLNYCAEGFAVECAQGRLKYDA
jgi:aminoglycoside phosphotransferase (APT) family kinase protein